jgi:competence protein ComEC
MIRSTFGRLLKLAILSAILICTASATTNDLTAHFLDVGQGDSILLQFNGKNVLIDGGTEESGPLVESYLRNHGVSSLDMVLATHPHEDHIGGLIAILNDFPIGKILDSGQTHTAPSFENYLNLIDQKNISYKVLERGQTIDLDPRIKIDVLSPPATPFADDINQNSIVLKVTYGNVSLLLMGDAGKEAEDSLLTSGYVLKSNILKVAHHGSSSASSSAFLARVNPEVSIIEVGAGNDYGHPAQKNLSALKKVGSKIYRTDLNGNIVVTTDGRSYSVSAEKQSGSLVPKGVSTPSAPSNGPVGPPTYIAAASPQQFVGSTKSDKYHYPSCQWAKKIKPGNEIWFGSSQDARGHGYVSCGACHPP